MHWYIMGVFLFMWVLAMASSYTFGGFVHILLGAAMVIAAYRLWKSRQDNNFEKPEIEEMP